MQSLEYTDCWYRREIRPFTTTTNNKKECPGYDIKLHLIVRLHFWSVGKRGVAIHCHYSLVYSEPRG